MEIVNAVLNLVSALCVIGILWIVFGDAILTRISPARAAKRRLKLQQKQARREEKRQQRLQSSPHAQKRQQRKEQKHKMRQSRQEKDDLDWALSNSSDPSARQHLEKVLARLQWHFEHEDWMVNHYRQMADFASTNQTENADRLQKAEHKRADLASKIAEIESALGTYAMSNQQ